MPLTPAAPRPSKSRPVWDHSFVGNGFLRVSALGLYRVKADMMVLMEILGYIDISGDSCLRISQHSPYHYVKIIILKQIKRGEEMSE